MPSLKEIRDRRASVASTRQITSAMKMVSAARLRKAQDAILRFRPYADKMIEILGNVAGSLQDDQEIRYAVNREKEQILLVLITSNRGLCGAFNTNAIKAAVQRALSIYHEQLMGGQVEFLAIGKKGYDFLRKKGYRVVRDGSDVFDDLTFENVEKLSGMVMEKFLKEDYDHVDLIYNRFKNAATQVLTEEQFLPVRLDGISGEAPASSFTDYIFEPSREYIVQELVPRSLRIQFYGAILDSYASEHGARMTAMHQATDNATELLKELSLQFNKARQASITTEILEIVSGAEALKG